jgi:hypothetical protein
LTGRTIDEVVAVKASLLIAATATAVLAAGYGRHDWTGVHTSISHGPAILNTTTVANVVAAFTNAGLPVTTPRAAGSKCPQLGRTEAVDSDEVSVIKFPNTGAAQRFAGSTRDVYQVEDLVLVFTENVSGAQKASFEQIERRWWRPERVGRGLTVRSRRRMAGPSMLRPRWLKRRFGFAEN